jgi:hypothetical protein
VVGLKIALLFVGLTWNGVKVMGVLLVLMFIEITPVIQLSSSYIRNISN